MMLPRRSAAANGFIPRPSRRRTRRHASRALVAWLACLPLATAPLHTADWTLALSTGLTAFLVLGIEDIGMQIEEPFAVLPLHDLALELSRASRPSSTGRRRPTTTFSSIARIIFSPTVMYISPLRASRSRFASAARSEREHAPGPQLRLDAVGARQARARD